MVMGVFDCARRSDQGLIDRHLIRCSIRQNPKLEHLYDDAYVLDVGRVLLLRGRELRAKEGLRLRLRVRRQGGHLRGTGLDGEAHPLGRVRVERTEKERK